MSPASDGEPFHAGVPPYPAPGRPEQPAPGRRMPASGIVVITACAVLTVLLIVGGLVLYVIAASESFEP